MSGELNLHNCVICGAQNNIKLTEQKKAEIALEMIDKFDEQDKKEDYGYNCDETMGEFSGWLWDLKEKEKEQK